MPGSIAATGAMAAPILGQTAFILTMPAMLGP